MKNTMIDYNKINDAVMKNAPLDTLIALCRDIDIESCFDPVFEPPKSFLDMCKHYWENQCHLVKDFKTGTRKFPVPVNFLKKVGKTLDKIKNFGKRSLEMNLFLRRLPL